MTIDDIMARLERGETLMIDDQWRSYIRIEDDDQPARFVMRSIRDTDEDAAIERGEQGALKYEEKRSRSLAELLLSLTDWKWHDKDGELTACQRTLLNDA